MGAGRAGGRWARVAVLGAAIACLGTFALARVESASGATMRSKIDDTIRAAMKDHDING
ncbi:MAG: hypothetical protein QOJ35_1424 [Solirubrobacteraceae bacterium]|nr:hypothetical protein [Solirubrobacteraceae bacterium]